MSPVLHIVSLQAGVHCKMSLSGQFNTRKYLKNVDNKLADISPVKSVSWGPRDSGKQSLEVSDMAKCRSHWRSCFQNIPLFLQSLN